jgi:metal-sulfur cluster biosynthetic enzyme
MTQSPAPHPNQLWQIDSSDPEKAAALRKAWSEVMDPELALNIVQLGMIRDVEIHEGQVLVKMILTTPYCPYGPAMMERTRIVAEKTLSSPVTMEMEMEPWDPSMMDEDVSSPWGLFP